MGRRTRKTRKKNDAGLSKKALWKEIRREERKKARARMGELRAKKKEALAARKLARASKVSGCKAAKERARTRARRSCETLEDRFIDAAVRFQGARAALEQEKKERRELRAIERSNRARKKEGAAGVAKAKERRSESDDEVRTNIPAELRPLFEKVKRGIKASARKSRTEAFLEYVEEHPREAWAEDDYEDRAAREMEERAMRANPKKKKKPSPAAIAWRRSAYSRRAETGKKFKRARAGNPKRKRLRAPSDRAADRALAAYEREHWGARGKGQVEKMSVIASRPGVMTKMGKLHSLRFRDRSGRAFEIRTARGAFLVYDARGRLAIATRRAPRVRAPIGKLGALVGIVYETKKGADRRPVLYDHDFSRRHPTLENTRAGLKITGGSYRVEARGIVG